MCKFCSVHMCVCVGFVMCVSVDFISWCVSVGAVMCECVYVLF